MTKQPAGAVAEPARAELLALVERTRPDIDIRRVGGILSDASTRGVPWPKAMVQTVLMCAHPAENAEDLRKALATNPWERR